ncbi:hypothetical protein [Ruania alba]|uniref:Uncharacterized protein n=1 Tax=Ruania alba TaxID=648782 RepID=A0A1H5K6V2_9MICO|nr:hypothetical protein [Ruania alba]SEE60593.1 hypothetical protein SAMN04488554_2120 [Ruania alba]
MHRVEAERAVRRLHRLSPEQARARGAGRARRVYGRGGECAGEDPLGTAKTRSVTGSGNYDEVSRPNKEADHDVQPERRVAPRRDALIEVALDHADADTRIR